MKVHAIGSVVCPIKATAWINDSGLALAFADFERSIIVNAPNSFDVPWLVIKFQAAELRGEQVS